MQDEPSVKLINLYYYESRRKARVSWATRLANVTGAASDEHVTRIATRTDGSLAVTHLDFDRAEAQASTSDAAALRFLEAFLHSNDSVHALQAVAGAFLRA
jgi:hypothetical protein